MRLVDRLRNKPSVSERAGMVQLFQSWQDGQETLPNDFVTYVREGYKDNGVVFGVILARMLLFSEARFIFRDRVSHELKAGDLKLLDSPWPNGTTGELLARMEQDVSLAGNAYVYKPKPGRLQRLRPDWVDIVSADRTEVNGYVYWEGGRAQKPTFIPVEEMAHWCPIPDPEANFRGMSWLTPVAREVDADTKMTRHKGKFFDNAATPNLIVSVEGSLNEDQRKRAEEVIKLRHEGTDNAYKTWLIEGGADVTVVGNSFEQISFSTVQAAGENRIAAAGGVPGIVVGLKEGLQAATYSNYAQAMRRFVDLTMRPLWRSASAALSPLVRVPDGMELWYDDRDIPALRQDAKEEAEIRKVNADTFGSLIRSGYDPEKVVEAVVSGDFSKLSHTGNVPVTLYPDGSKEELTPKESPDDQGDKGTDNKK